MRKSILPLILLFIVQIIRAQSAPTLLLPADEAVNIPITYTYTWSSVSGATYTIQISTSPGFTNNQVNVSGLTTTSYQATGLYYSTPYYWRVGANTGSGNVWSSSRTFTTGSPGGGGGNPGPVLISPANGTTNFSQNGSFSWNAVSGAAYRIQISTSNYFGWNQVDISGLTSPSYTASGLYLATTYYWRVNAITSSGTSDWSSVWSFTTSLTPPTTPAVPTLASPANNSTNIPINPALSWNASSGASTYNLQVSTNSQFSSYVVNQTGLAGLNYNPSNLSYSTSYYWRVSAANSSGTSGWSSVWNFTTGQANPAAPDLASPLNNAGEVQLNPQLSWNSSSGASSYSLQVSTDEGFSSFIVNQTGITGLNYSLSNLSYGTEYFWRVNAVNSTGASAWSASNKFTTVFFPAQTIISPEPGVVTNQSNITVSGTVNNNSITVKINGNPVQVMADNSFSDFAVLTEGSNEIVIKAKNIIGDSVVVTRYVTMDSTAPVITIVNPMDNYFTNQSTVLLRGSVSDFTFPSVVVNGDTIPVNFDLSFEKTITLNAGTNIITIIATDEAGNQTTITRNVTLDTYLPVITITSPADNYLTNLPSIDIVGIVSDSTAVTLTINGNAVTLTGGSFTYPFALVEGNNTITIVATDEAGNTTTEIRTMRRDSTPPNLTVTSPADNFSTNLNSVNVAGTANDASFASVTINGNNISLTGGAFTATITLTEGSNPITIIAADSAGNSATVNRTVIYNSLIIPIDPALVAPQIDDSYAKTFYDANSFLWADSNAIQYDYTPNSIEFHRAGVVRGTVVNINGQPLPGVKVSSPNHPEWGHTYTRADGNYDFGLNAGGYLSVNFERSGYRPANRIFDSPWNHFVVLDTVALVQVDPQSAVISFNNPFEILQSSESTDQDGRRRATIFFEQGTVTTLTLQNNSTQILDSITARATEYSIGQYGRNAMPANLPPSVSYTYCTDLTADEALAANAKSVTFDKPVRLFTENFIGFPVGTSVPTGIWDWSTFSWLPRENGTVIKIVGVTNGLADISIKTDGSIASQSQLDSLGIIDTERTYIANTFTVGQTLWRTRLTEFGIIDQGFATIQPDNAAAPKVERIERFVNEDKYGSLTPAPGVDVLNQTLHEEINITGTPFSLTYSSDRVEGRKSQLVIPLTGSTIQPSLVKIILKVTVLGVEHKVEYSPQPNLSHTFVWNGIDGFGRTAPGRHKADILIGYVHSSNYQAPVTGKSSFGSMSGVSIPGIYSRETTTLWQCAQALVGEVDNRAATLGGWNLNIHNGFDQVTNTTYLGSGQNQISEKLGYILGTVAGTGTYAYAGENVIASQSPIGGAGKLIFAPDGSVYFYESGARRIRKIDPYGIMTTVVGDGTSGYPADGAVALQSPLNGVSDLALDKNGDLLFLIGGSGARLYRLEKNGVVKMLVGALGYGFSGDGGPAENAKLYRPSALEVDAEGSIYIADQNWIVTIPASPKYTNTRIRKIDPEGIITTVAGGDGQYTANPQSLPATQVIIEYVNDLKIGPDGDLYIASVQNYNYVNPLRQIILKLGKDGRLHKITRGGWTTDTFEEGMQANLITLRNIGSITFDRGCSLCYTESSNEAGFRAGIITPDYIKNLLTGKDAAQNQSSNNGTPARLSLYSSIGSIEVGPGGGGHILY